MRKAENPQRGEFETFDEWRDRLRGTKPQHAGSWIKMLTDRKELNPFWMGGNYHRCAKCKQNDKIKTLARSCDLCDVKIEWL